MNKNEFRMRVLAHGRAKVRLPKQLPPIAIVRSYRSKLVRGPIEDAMSLIRSELVPTLEHLAASASRIATTDVSDDIGKIMDSIRASHAKKWTRERFGSVVENIGPQLEKFHAQQLNRQMRELITVDVVGTEPWLAPAVAEFTRENVALIRTIPTTFFDGLEKKLASEIADGVRWEEMVSTIEKEHDVSKNRAELIARDQAGKFMGDLNRVRQSDLGIENAIWRTVNDNRVREEHADREGQSFSWAEGIDGETPGEPVLCRCSGEPDIEALLAED